MSQGVKDYLGTEVMAKGSKFTKRDLESLDYTIIQLSKWTADSHKNDMTVSYTHLDVYKRQALYIPGSLVTVMPGTSKAGMWFMRKW